MLLSAAVMCGAESKAIVDDGGKNQGGNYEGQHPVDALFHC